MDLILITLTDSSHDNNVNEEQKKYHQFSMNLLKYRTMAGSKMEHEGDMSRRRLLGEKNIINKSMI